MRHVIRDTYGSLALTPLRTLLDFLYYTEHTTNQPASQTLYHRNGCKKRNSNTNALLLKLAQVESSTTVQH